MTSLSLFSEAELPIALKPPSEFRRIGFQIAYEFKCVRCGYEWCGNPIAGERSSDVPEEVERGDGE